MSSRLLKLGRCGWSDQALLMEALAWLCGARLLLLLVPFRWLAPRLGQAMSESPAQITESERKLALRVSWAVQAVARNLPLGFVCLSQAIAAKWMLQRRRLATTLYLGVARPEQATLTAHAWLRAGDKILTGREASLQHTTIAWFGGK